MPEEKNPPVIACEETRTENGVGWFLEKYLNHLEEILGVILEVRIMNYG